ncbi:MAG: UMP kinase [Clostridiales Family XIII bacterium]|nr:UMP kinase [Clostridiales Family XIII bacterium]
MKPKYKRIILKISGEALAGPERFGLNDDTLDAVSGEIKSVADQGVGVAIVVGGGNFWRGRSSDNMDRATADYMGMLATVINALALQSSLEDKGLSVRVHTAIAMTEVAEPYIRRKAISQIEKGDVVIFAAGTGSPFFSTDTTAALRAAEIGAEAIFLAKKIDAVYSADPEIYPDAERYTRVSYLDIIDNDLGVMDATAASLCKENNIPIIVFKLADKGNILKALNGEDIGTIVSN